MDIEDFWKIIDECAAAGPDPQHKLEVLRRQIQSLEPDDIVAFANHFDACMDGAYRWDVWAAAYILAKGCGDDAFMDFRASQICRGRSAFERLLSDPDALADEPFGNVEEECFFEGFQYVPMEVYEEKTGNELPARYAPHPSEPAGETWNEEGDDLKQVCPKLWQQHGWMGT